MYTICALLVVITLYSYHVFVKQSALTAVHQLKELWFRLHCSYPAWRAAHYTQEPTVAWWMMLRVLDLVLKLNKVDYILKYRSDSPDVVSDASTETKSIELSKTLFTWIVSAEMEQTLRLFLENECQCSIEPSESVQFYDLTRASQITQCFASQKTNVPRDHRLQRFQVLILTSRALQKSKTLTTVREIFLVLNDELVECKTNDNTSITVLWDASLDDQNVTDVAREYMQKQPSLGELQLALCLDHHHPGEVLAKELLIELN